MKNSHTYSKKFTDKEVEKIVNLRRNGGTWHDIAAKLNKEWFNHFSPDVYAGIYRRFGAKVLAEAKRKRKPHPYEDFTREALGDIVKVNKSNKLKKRYFVSSVGAAADLHKKGFATVRSFCEKMGAQLVLFPTPAHVKALEDQPNHYDPCLLPYKSSFATEMEFNERLKGLELRLNPQQIRSLTGLRRIRGRDQLSDDESIQNLIKSSKKSSLIVAHTKQMMESIPTGNNTDPRILHSTGSLTCPKHLRNRIGIIAEEDHVLGGLIVEVHGKEFYVTQIQIHPKDGSFVDKFGSRFHTDGSVVQERAEAFVMGDIHPGLEDQTALEVWYDVWNYIKPKRIFLHDWFDGLSISHHVKDKKIH